MLLIIMLNAISEGWALWCQNVRIWLGWTTGWDDDNDDDGDDDDDDDGDDDDDDDDGQADHDVDDWTRLRSLEEVEKPIEPRVVPVNPDQLQSEMKRF